MEKRWFWFLLAGIWLVAGGANLVEGRQWQVIAYDFLAVGLFLFLGICQGVLERRGDAGRKILRRMQIAGIVAALALVVVMLILG